MIFKKEILKIFFKLILCLSILACKNENAKKPLVTEDRETSEYLNEFDGPYIYTQHNNRQIISVKKSADAFYVSNDTISLDKNSFTSQVNNASKDTVKFSLMSNYKIPPHTYEKPEKVFVTSDIEGNFNGFYSLLYGNNVIDDNFHWTFGNGHVVICGDMFDRGSEVIPALWLLYKLEKEAKTKGGQVHFILGNHDVMNIYTDIRYVDSKYIKLAKIISGKEDAKAAYKDLMSDNNELVKWVKTKNTIEKIGNDLFLHGGISQELIDANLSIKEINDVMRQFMTIHLSHQPSDNSYANLLQGSMGPIWYRGLVKESDDKYKKASFSDVDIVLKHYNAEHIIIGHTIVNDEVTTDYNGKVIRVDIKHPKEKFTGKGSALLIENNTYYKVNDKGERTKLEMDID